MHITKASGTEIFLWFALQECARALEQFDAARRHAAERKSLSPGIEQREVGSVFHSLRLALHYTASISRIFWTPSREQGSRDRSERLRKLIKLRTDHPLHQRRWRDHFEHLDERLDRWVQDSPREFTTVEMVLYADSHDVIRQVARASVAIAYDESESEFLLFGDRFKINEIEAGIAEVRDLISAYLGEARRADTFVV